MSERQARELLAAQDNDFREVSVSLDLGSSKSDVAVGRERIVFPDGQTLERSMLEKITGEYCFLIEDGKVFRIQTFSRKTNKTYKLLPTQNAPALSISGVRMHQTKDMSPLEDAVAKANAVRPLKGKNVLDTCMGLGYSAIQAFREGAMKVTTVEADEAVMELAKVNPWSSELFSEDTIEVTGGDVNEVVSGLEDACFDRIIHDPPTMTLAGGLYGREFYTQLHRILKPAGILFHYVGRPGSRFRNRRIMKGVIERLRETGFRRVERVGEAQGVKAVKTR